MDKKNMMVIAGISVLVGAVAFFGGMKYGSNEGDAGSAQRQRMTGGGGTGFGQGTFAGQGTRGGNRAIAGGGLINGEIISKDDKSITLKLRDGGSKIVFFSTSTEVSKFIKGDAVDLATGNSVMIMGATNSDGSVVAQTIQLRPEMIQPVPATK